MLEIYFTGQTIVIRMLAVVFTSFKNKTHTRRKVRLDNRFHVLEIRTSDRKTLDDFAEDEDKADEWLVYPFND